LMVLSYYRALIDLLTGSFAEIFGTSQRASGERCILFAISGRKFKVPWYILVHIRTYWYVFGMYWRILVRFWYVLLCICLLCICSGMYLYVLVHIGR